MFGVGENPLNGNGNPLFREGEDIVSSLWKHRAVHKRTH
ncbi:hypothetical protein PBI_PBS1_97 [Bacillus phage PBS1]|uniref:Uncharacterized protein n=1 Tax=Bacillus phage PBS1 TaxID=2884423 RepID=A0A223LC42_BPPB1|nr:hypothetical protein FK780_gp097 [Bacillus phage PBS1]AST99919.1 hypothetical protein PBI_PBS1_97 [Bacillus phage PBS1]